MKKLKYALYVNDVLYDYFNTIKEIDEYIFENGLSIVDYNDIKVQKVKNIIAKKGRKNGRL